MVLKKLGGIPGDAAAVIIGYVDCTSFIRIQGGFGPCFASHLFAFGNARYRSGMPFLLFFQ